MEVALALIAGLGVGAVLALWLTRGKSHVNQGLVGLVEAVQDDRRSVVDREAAASQLVRERADAEVRAARESFDSDRAMLMAEIHRLQGFTTQLLERRVAEVPEGEPLKVPTLTPAERVAKATGNESEITGERAKNYLKLLREGHSHENAMAILDGRDEDLTPTEELDQAVQEATMRAAAVT